MSSLAAPVRLTAASISPAQPLAPSVTNTTATASAPASSSHSSQTSSSSRSATLFSSLLSATWAKPHPKPSSTPSVASSSVSVSVTTSPPPHHRAASAISTTTTSVNSPTSLRPRSTTTQASITPSSNTLPSSSHLHQSHPLAPAPASASAPAPAQATPVPALSTQREIDQARSAVLASIGNLLDRELTTRAAQLHANNAAIERQERDVARATDALRKENDKLGKLAEVHSRKVKEIGNVQNWAEMLEREFVILEETLRLVEQGDSDGSEDEGSWSGSGSDEGEDEDVLDGGEEGIVVVEGRVE
ncbi:hypothetical protein N657DRAFT_681772 [Parathielavia appendiculata]|uniref:Biogenesis of lysosome-related organelles complex 1 subunit 1 n=1 Tax=Parathielavia appendiculata TaxID=2587402 RepID=A0AAN6TZ37_9PEZI|nr:hypothetical protein N657DRAFT_681772 [Parathielavia appendiculata]